MIGSTFSHYRILEKLGEGGMGVVYKAEDSRLGRTVAIKLLSPLVKEHPQYRLRLQSEAQAVASLDHPNTCTIHDVGEHEGRPYIVMGYIEGQTLRERLGAGAFPVDETLDLAIQMARGLTEAHRRGIIHRDIKPANVMITPDGQAKLMDFGLARIADQTQITKTGMVLGTPAYMSPEQSSGKPVDHRTDVWSFGAVLYEMLTGTVPFPGDQPAAVVHGIQTQDPTPPRKVRAKVSEELERVCLRSMSKKPGARYAEMAEALAELEAYRDISRVSVTGEMVAREVRRRLLRPRVWVPAVAVLLIAAAVASWIGYRRSRAQWAREVALPEIERLAEKYEMHAAFLLAREAQRWIPGHPDLEAAWPKIATTISLLTTPDGARVSLREHGNETAEWIPLGRTPLEKVRIPQGASHWRFEKAGYRTVEAGAIGAPFGVTGNDGTVTLLAEGELPPEMVRVPANDIPCACLGAHIHEYLIDRHEVTNRQYKEFVDANGYRNDEYWKQPFVRDGEEIPRQEAMALFVDTAGAPGPAEWELGEYPEGSGDYPVTGVSWFEAAAYAEWSGKSLPTMLHWYTAAWGPHHEDHHRMLQHAAPFTQAANMSDRGGGPVEAGTYPSIGAAGAFDMAGNVKEWCWNLRGDERWVYGGSWSDPGYIAFNPDPQDPFLRDRSLGFRCVRYLPGKPPPDEALRVLPARRRERPDYSQVQTASDETFEVYRRLYAHDRVDPEAEMEERVGAPPYHVRERVRFRTASAPEGMPAYLYLPKAGAPPYQAVVVFPGSAVVFNRFVDDIRSEPFFEIFTRSGRAVVLPVYDGTLDRGGGEFRGGDTAIADRDRRILWTREYAYTLDYLESRDDIDPDGFAFWGLSMGAGMAPFVLVIEERLKTAIIVGAGISGPAEVGPYPETSEFNFLPRIRVPVLMLGGSQDEPEVGQRPLFNLIGTPDEHKRFVVLEGGHIPPIERDFIREQLDWLNKYVGPVE